MTFICIDQDGGLTTDDRVPNFRLLDELVGPHGRDKSYLKPTYRTIVWVSDCGLLMPEVYARNPVGACVVAMMGGPQQPYAGRMVFTGYDYGDSWGGPETLWEPGAAYVRLLHEVATQALAGRPLPHADSLPFGDDAGESLRELAEFVRNEDVPPTTARVIW